jgi:hypothetical protein
MEEAKVADIARGIAGCELEKEGRRLLSGKIGLLGRKRTSIHSSIPSSRSIPLVSTVLLDSFASSENVSSVVFVFFSPFSGVMGDLELLPEPGNRLPQ